MPAPDGRSVQRHGRRTLPACGSLLLLPTLGLVVGEACGLKHRGRESIVVGHRRDEALTGHFTVTVSHNAEGCLDTLDQAIVAENFRLVIELPIERIAVAIGFPHWQVRT